MKRQEYFSYTSKLSTDGSGSTVKVSHQKEEPGRAAFSSIEADLLLEDMSLSTLPLRGVQFWSWKT